jgi:hypothetical protein
MSDIMDSLKGILTVIAVGVPALLILLGFTAAVFGWVFGYVTNDTGMRNFGILLIVIGVVLYLIEIAAYYYSQQNQGSY